MAKSAEVALRPIQGDPRSLSQRQIDIAYCIEIETWPSCLRRPRHAMQTLNFFLERSRPPACPPPQLWYGSSNQFVKSALQSGQRVMCATLQRRGDLPHFGHFILALHHPTIKRTGIIMARRVTASANCAASVKAPTVTPIQ